MIKPVFIRKNPVCLIGGGPVGGADLAQAMALAPSLVAVDEGASHAMRAGFTPETVIGDLDSIAPETLRKLDPQTVCRIDEQDSTDFEKALARVAAPLILGVGFTGGRVDHELAVLSALVGWAHKPCVLLSQHEAIFHCPSHLRLDLPADAVVSLFPLLPVTGRSTGLKWPIDGLELAPGGRVGTSNQALGGSVEIWTDGPGLIALLPRTALGPITRALAAI